MTRQKDAIAFDVLPVAVAAFNRRAIGRVGGWDVIEGFKKERPTNLRGHKARVVRQDGVVHRKRVAMPMRVNQKCRVGQPQASIVRRDLECSSKRSLRVVNARRVVLGKAQRPPRLRVRLVKRDGSLKGLDRICVFAPTKKAGPEHSMRVRVGRSDPRRLFVGRTRFVPPALELPRVADPHARPRIVWKERRRVLEGITRTFVAFGAHLRARQFHPDACVVRILREGLAIVSCRGLERAFVHRATRARERPRGAGGQKEGPENGDQSRLTRTGIEPTMLGMTRDDLLEILKRTPGVKETKKGFDVTDGHELSFYIGGHGQSTLIGEVKHLVAETKHLEATVTDRRTFFIPYESITMCSSRAPRDNAERRTGFA